ncbi:hypothetical protein AAHA92_18716 [Salvia divinorum]|uniref:Cytochrome P450 n=1 Tax=Salvia divinorum TaxID=28513 RepID=A0ABD1H300_SALDI
MPCKHPLIQDKVVQEVKLAAEVRDELSVDEFVLKLTEAALDKMQYLHAALTETLRLYPAVPVDGKSADEDDILPDGHRIKKGDGISYMPYAMRRIGMLLTELCSLFTWTKASSLSMHFLASALISVISFLKFFFFTTQDL